MGRSDSVFLSHLQFCATVAQKSSFAKVFLFFSFFLFGESRCLGV